MLGLLVKLYDGRIGVILFSNRLVDRSELSKDSFVEQSRFSSTWTIFVASYLSYVQ
jgi:hypothetical protein